jgi:hypothetical protein
MISYRRGFYEFASLIGKIREASVYNIGGCHFG